MDMVVYVHGKDGSADESRHYAPLFADMAVIGIDYKTFTPWETGKEIRDVIENLKKEYDNILLVANSIGAFFSMNAGIDGMIQKAYFISPIVDMEKLICNMMTWANVTEAELESKKTVHTSFGEDLSWEYLRYVREHPVKWHTPTEILYGEYDNLMPYETVESFAKRHNAGLTVMKGGEHWFHTDEQMRFVDDWINNTVF